MNRFEITGKILKPKSDKIVFFDEKTSENGWMSRALKFNVKSGDNTFLMEIRDGRSKDDSKALIYSTIKKDGKYENVQFLHKDKEKYIPQLAEFKKSVIVFDKDTRLEFATQYDIALALKDIIENEEYANTTFKVVGEIEYSRYEGKEYKKMIPTRIYVSEQEESAVGTVDVLFGEGSFDDTTFEDNKIAYINGYVAQYDRNAKKQLAFAQQIEYNFEKVHGENAEKAYKVMKRIFDVSGEELHKIGFKVEHVNGTTSVPFTIDMATDEEKEMVELGFMTMDDLKSQYGAGKGGFVSKVEATGLAKGYGNGAIETGQTLADYQEEVSSEEEIFDIFDM